MALLRLPRPEINAIASHVRIFAPGGAIIREHQRIGTLSRLYPNERVPPSPYPRSDSEIFSFIGAA